MKAVVTLPSMDDPGGVAGFFRSVLPRLAERGVEVSPLEIGSTHGSFGLFHPVRDQIELSGLLRRERTDLVHVNPSLDIRSFFRDGLFVRQALRRRLPVVVLFHGWQEPFEAVVEKRLHPFFRRTYGRAHVVLCLSAAVAAKLRAWGVSAPIHVTSTAIPDDFVSGFSMHRKQDLLRAAGRKRILFLARLERTKGILETIQAVNLLVTQGHDVHLDIAGNGGAEEEARALASELPGLGGRVTFHGYARGAEKRALLESCHLYCFPSHTEGMPVSLLEAFAFGLPVVTRAVGGIREIFEDGAMGSVAPGPDPAGIAESLKKVLRDPGRMAQIGTYNHEWVMRRCLASSAAEHLRSSYQEACARAEPGESRTP